MERLARLMEEDECTAKCKKYADELRKMADQIGETTLCRFGPLLFKAMCDPNRLKILKMLATREMCVCELNVALDISQGTISFEYKRDGKKGDSGNVGKAWRQQKQGC